LKASASLTKIAAQLPPDVKLQILEDQSGLSAPCFGRDNVHPDSGSILASLVVLFFMRN
jgi:hypothetical protein